MNPFEIFKQKPDKAPFENWKPSKLRGGSAEFFDLPAHPEIVVRKFSEFGVKQDGKNLTNAESIGYWSERAKALEGFADRYGIKMAKTGYFVGNDPRFTSETEGESSPAFMAATEKISGKNLKEIPEFDEKSAVEVDNMFSGLFAGIRDSYNEDGYWWRDYGNTQVMYGIAPKETEPHVYIVDVDPRMAKWNEFLPQRKEYIFWSDMGLIFEKMKELEKKYAHSTKQFENARKTLADIITKMPVPTNETAIDLREQLISGLR